MLKTFYLSILLFSTLLCTGAEKTLCFGDSITAGTYIKGHYTLGVSWVSQLDEKSNDQSFVNIGRSGRKTSNRRELLNYLKELKTAQRIIFSLGVNDLNKPGKDALNQCVENIDWMIKQCQKINPAIKIVICSSTGLNMGNLTQRNYNLGYDEKEQRLLEQLADKYQEYCQKNNFHFIDLRGVVASQNFHDGLHPNVAGQKQITEVIWASLFNKKGKIKIACIGDSITYGYGINDRRKTYPAQLEALLGSSYEVQNFGVSARTLLKKGNHPYWKETAYRNALTYQPNKVIIKLGTNDVKDINWSHKASFATDLKQMVKSFQQLASKPQVYLSLPVPVEKTRWTISDKRLKNELIPIIRLVAKELNLAVIDFYNAVPSRPEFYIDGVHPNARGAEIMAHTARQSLTQSNELTQLKLATLFTDHMVLQRNKKINVWGWAKVGEKVQVSLNGKSSVCVSNAQGKWKTQLPAMKVGGPYFLEVESGGKKILLSDVMLGDVWICSGQSNMQMALKGEYRTQIIGGKEAIKTAGNYKNLRLFHLKKRILSAPMDKAQGHWKRSNSLDAANFSATAFFFGRKLQKDLDVPIGLIQTAWGGSTAEAWTNGKLLKKMPEFRREVEGIENVSKNNSKLKEEYQNALAQWEKSLQKKAFEGFEGKWYKKEFDSSAWPTVKVPARWSQTALKNFTGAVCFRKEINIPTKWQGQKLIVELGPIDDIDVTSFNGQLIGQNSTWSTKRRYSIKASLVNREKNILIIKVLNPSGEGGICGNADEMKIYPVGKKKEALKLAGQWSYQKNAKQVNLPKKPSVPGWYDHHSPTVLYNGMIKPLIPYSICGVIWYQGESNASNATLYQKLFPQVVQNWRDEFAQGDFPFYYSQIAPYRNYRGRTGVELRDVQRRCETALPNMGMSVLMDKTHLGNIHPPYKKEAGERLALIALAKTYGKKISSSGPKVETLKRQGASITINFSHSEGGLHANKNALTSFEIAAADGRFYPATAVVNKTSITLSNPKVTEPSQVRYAWKNAAVGGLFNKVGLPASSFLVKLK